MRIAIMQPYFFPYLGQFQLINAVNRFILCDDVQYMRHSWINRNKILKPNEGSYYITVPIVKHSSSASIKDIQIVESDDWKRQILKQVEHYKKKAKYFPEVYSLLQDCLHLKERNITEMNAHCFEKVCAYIGIAFKKEISSIMNLDYSEVKSTDDWALRICEQLGATEYINPPGGINLYSKNKFEKSNIKLSFLQPDLKEYNQFRNTFEPSLSIVDVMMFNSPEEIRSMLNDYIFL